MKKKVSRLGKKLIKHELIAGSAYVFIGTLIASILSFLLNLFLARNLSASDYGEYASLLSVMTLAAIPAQSILPVIVRFATDFFASKDIAKARFFYISTIKVIAMIAIFILLLFMVLTPFIATFLKIDDYSLIFTLGLIVAIQYMAIINIAYLQSLIKFSFVSLTFILTAFFRLILTVILVFFGYKVFGALLGTLFGFFVGFIFGFFPLKFLLKGDKKERIDFKIREILRYAVPTTTAILFLNSFISVDVILVKHFFNASQAGLYGGLSLVGKAIFYFTGIIPGVMFPLLIRRHSNGESFHRLFYLALLLVAIPSMCISVFYFIFPQFTLNLFLGKKYLEVAPYLGLFAIFITIFNMLNVFVNFFLSLKKTKVFVFVIISAVLQIILIFLFHDSFYQVISVSLIASVIFLIFLFLYYLKEFGQFNEIKKLISAVNTPIEW